MARVRVNSKYQVVLPVKIRETLGVCPGDEIDFSREGSEVVVRKAGRSGLQRFAEFAGPIWRGYAEEIRHKRDESPR